MSAFFKKYKTEVLSALALAALIAAFWFFVWKQDVSKETMENKNIQAFLKMIRWAEGTAGVNGYKTMFSGVLFHDFSDHPRQFFKFKQTDGKMNRTSAAGAYQFLISTWDRLKSRLSLPDFSPENQDKAAIQLIKEKNALDDVINGRIDEAIKKCSPVWASLAYSKAPQPKKKIADLLGVYQKNGGGIA